MRQLKDYSCLTLNVGLPSSFVTIVPRSIRPTTLAFLVTLTLTLLVWILRGVRLLTFIPGSVLWVLILACFITAILNAIR